MKKDITKSTPEKPTQPQSEGLTVEELEEVKGGTASPSFKNYGHGGPVLHTLGPKQDDPNNTGGFDR